MSLPELQKKFMRDIQKGFGESGSTLHQFSPAGTLTPTETLDVYRNNTRMSRLNALQDNYPVCLQIVGESYFNQMGRLYIKKYPPRAHDLNIFGEDFPDYIDNLRQEKKELENFAYLADLARLERAWNRAYYAPNPKGFDFEQFAQTPEEEQEHIQFILHPALSILHASFTIQKLWEVHRQAETTDEIEIHEKSEYLVITRTDMIPEIENTTPKIFQLLDAIKQRKHFGELINLFPIEEAQQVLMDLIKKQWVTDFFIPQQ